MALKTTLEQLEEVQAAITAVMTSQSMTTSGGRIDRADLAALQAREVYLQKKYNAEQGTGGGTTNYASFNR
jgi:hypothetical protein